MLAADFEAVAVRKRLQGKPALVRARERVLPEEPARPADAERPAAVPSLKPREDLREEPRQRLLLPRPHIQESFGERLGNGAVARHPPAHGGEDEMHHPPVLLVGTLFEESLPFEDAYALRGRPLRRAQVIRDAGRRVGITVTDREVPEDFPVHGLEAAARGARPGPHQVP